MIVFANVNWPFLSLEFAMYAPIVLVGLDKSESRG